MQLVSERLEAEWWNVNAEAEEAKSKCQKKSAQVIKGAVYVSKLRREKKCCHFLFFFRCGDRCAVHTHRAADSWGWREIKDRNHPLSGPPRLSLLDAPHTEAAECLFPQWLTRKVFWHFILGTVEKSVLFSGLDPGFSSALCNPSRHKKKQGCQTITFFNRD